jgi:translation initiation factor IF-3
MDYGKYKYEAAQKAKESRRKASNVSIKEMKYRPKISKGDFDTKTRKVERFLEEGHKVKVTLTFRGREMHHPELGRRILDQVVEAVEHVGKVEIFPRQDGRNMTMVLGPDRKAQAAAERAKRQAQAEARGESPPRSGARGARPDAAAADASDPAASNGEATTEAPTEAPTDAAAEPTPDAAAEPTPVSAAATDTGQPAPQDQPSDG